MVRTLTSKHDRNSLWLYQKGLCALCEKPLDSTWEADHIVPFRLTGKTNVHEMQATCRPCNRRKGGIYSE